MTEEKQVITLPCGHAAGEPGPPCLTCERYHNDDGFRESVARNQDHIRAALDARKKAPPTRIELCRYIGDEPVDRLDCACAHRWLHECEVYGVCNRNDPDNREGVQSCSACPQYRGRGTAEPDAEFERIVFQNKNAPGDTVAMTAAVEALHLQHPGRYVTDVESPSPAVWEGNPHVRRLTGEARVAAKVVELKYDAIHRSDDLPIHFLEAYCWSVSAAVGRKVVLHRNTPVIRLREEERHWLPQVSELTGNTSKVPYVVVNAGHKRDFTAKFWGHDNWRRLAAILGGEVMLVQIGEGNPAHVHEPLPGVLNLIGKTDQRQLIRVVWNAAAAVGPSTFIQHVAAAVGTPYVLIAGGREPRPWQEYPRQRMHSAVGTLRCCASRACWRSRVVRLNDGAEEDKSICEAVVLSRDSQPIPKCLAEITPEQVADSVRKLMRVNHEK